MSHVRAIELWRPVVGLEEFFEVSNCGGVRAGGRPVWPSVDKGYRRVKLGGRRRSVHSLVLEAFVCPRPPGLLGLHRDDAKWHNHVSNLYWGTASDNARDSVRNGTHTMVGRTHCPRGHELAPWNLVPASLPARICKACNRARAYLKCKHLAGCSEDLFCVTADEYYASARAALDMASG